MKVQQNSRRSMPLPLFAFTFLVAIHCGCIQAFSPISTAVNRPVTTRLYEQSEKKQSAPQYDKLMASLVKAEPVAKGTVLLHIEADDDATWEYEPGHVLALEIKGNPKDKTTHTYEDTKKNNGWMRGPYTVTASPSNKELQVLVKLVGEKSQAFADAKPGTPIQVGGKFKVPIVDGIDVDSTKQVVLFSTGVGIGPCVGAMEKVMGKVKAGDVSFPPIHLVASFRTNEEIALADKLNQMQTDYPKQFSWTPVVTSGADGRVSSSVKRLQESLLVSSNIRALDLAKTHFHLIGNGELVYEFQKGLKGAGVPDEKVTLEIYFNHQAKPSDKAVETIAEAIQGMTEDNAMAISSSSSSSSSIA